MARVDADRNLLFGLLALQNNFIDRDALLDAFSRWVHDRAVPLGQILRDRGALDPDDHEALEVLVARYLKKFRDDPEKSLQHLSSIGSVRDDLALIADADLQASLAQVAAARPDEDPYRTISQASLGASTSTGSRFRILRPHARGGLGQVSVALDQELDRPVALKEIQDHRADEPESRARFVQEAEITGKLEHPGIIPVYGLGHDLSGRPYYAMRFIQGDSLKEAIAAFHGDECLKNDPVTRLSRLRELLRRFTDVCNAIAYAHSRGVLHRDLKPGNIMLGPYGETLVVDWGLAKPVGAELPAGVSPPSEGPIRLSEQSGSRAETVAGSPVGTPAYASPEQVTGAWDRLGPASDVYGLGATLYALLTGRAPVEADDLGEVIGRVQRGEIPPPRSIDPTIPAPLEAICRKATATAPADRYDSAGALAKDVTRWLDDEPVTAYREPFLVQAGRWIRRHRTAVTGAATALLAGLIGVAAMMPMLARANSILEAKTLQLIAANAAKDQALTETQDEKKKTEEALLQKGVAFEQSEKSRMRAEAVLSFLKDDVLAAARPEGHGGGLGVDITVRKAVDAAEPRIAERFKKLPIVEADVRDMLGSTYYYLGDRPLAIRQYERALELCRINLGPDHRDTLTVRSNLAEAYLAAGRIAEAINMSKGTLKARESTLGPDHPDTLTSRNNLALAYFAAGRTAEAINIIQGMLSLFESRFGPDHPDTLTIRNNLAATYLAAGRNNDATELHKSTLKLLQSKLGPEHPITLLSRSNLAEAYRAAGHTAEAIGIHEETLKLRESKLGREHPDTLTSRSNLANVYLAVGRATEAIEIHEGTLKLRESKLGTHHPDTLISRSNLANAYRAAGRTTEAIEIHEGTLKLRESKLGTDHPDTLTSRNNLAEAYRGAGRTHKALAMHEETLKLRERRLGPNHPNTLTSRNNLAEAYHDTGRVTEAIKLHQKTLGISETNLGPVHPHTLLSRNNLAAAYESLGRWGEAEVLRREAVNQRRKAEKPDSPLLAGDLSGLGHHLLARSRCTEAEPHLREALTIRRRVTPDAWEEYDSMSLLGGSLLGQGRHTEAELLVVPGYEGMKSHEAKIPAWSKPSLAEAAERVVRLYEGWGKPGQAEAWKRKLGLADLPADVFASP